MIILFVLSYCSILLTALGCMVVGMIVSSIVEVIDYMIGRGRVEFKLSPNHYRTMCRHIGIFTGLPSAVLYRGAILSMWDKES